jgi:hypothetical protein
VSAESPYFQRTKSTTYSAFVIGLKYIIKKGVLSRLFLHPQEKRYGGPVDSYIADMVLLKFKDNQKGA